MLEYKKQDKPKSIEMCLSADTVSKNLWNAADGLEKTGKLIMYIMIAIGLIAAIGDFASLSDLDEMTAFISAVSVFFQWGLYAMIAVTAFWGHEKFRDVFRFADDEKGGRFFVPAQHAAGADKRGKRRFSYLVAVF